MINIDTHVVIIQEKVDKLNSQLKIKKNIKLISGYIISKLNSKDTTIIIYIYKIKDETLNIDFKYNLDIGIER